MSLRGSRRPRGRRRCPSSTASATAAMPLRTRSSALCPPPTSGGCRASSGNFSARLCSRPATCSSSPPTGRSPALPESWRPGPSAGGKSTRTTLCACRPPVFDLSTPEKTARFTGTTEADIGRAIRGVSERRTNRHMFPRTPAFITELISQPMYNSARRTANLRVGDDCVGCGLCAKKCPVQAIEMRDGKPVWVKDKCVMCLGCLHRCPKFAYHQLTRANTVLAGRNAPILLQSP